MPSEDGTPRRRAENGEALSPKGKVFWVLWGQRVARPQRELCRLVSRKHGGCGGTSCFLWASGRVFPSRTFLSVQPQSSQQSVPLLIFYKGNAAPHDGIYVVHIRRGGGELPFVSRGTHWCVGTTNTNEPIPRMCFYQTSERPLRPGGQQAEHGTRFFVRLGDGGCQGEDRQTPAACVCLQGGPRSCHMCTDPPRAGRRAGW